MLEKQIQEIERAEMPLLKERFKAYFGWDSKARNKEFFRAKIIYRLQELEYDGLSYATKSLLQTMAVPKEKIVLSIGSVLEKTYKGNIYRVKVCKGYFEMDNKKYPTLSAVARAISNQRLSGNRFFNIDGGIS